MKLRSVSLIFAVILIVGFALTFYFGYKHKTRGVENSLPQQVWHINSLLAGEMEPVGDGEWKREEGGFYYHFYNPGGENTGYSKLIVTVEVKKAENLENIKKIAAHYFPDKADEIYLAVQDRYDKFKNNKVEVGKYSFIDLNNRTVMVKAFNVGSERYVSMEILLPVEGSGQSG